MIHESLRWYIPSIIQGLTEFLPISSSAHLILIEQLLGNVNQDLVFDVILHMGTLMSVMIYFHKDIYKFFVSPFLHLQRGFSQMRSQDTKMANFILLATLPAALSGILLHEIIEQYLRSQQVIAIATIGFALLLYIADIYNRKRKTHITLTALTWQNALWIGLFQAVALIPGTSRSGITITAALLLGISQKDSLRFSYYLSIPIITLASLYGMYQLFLDVNFSLTIATDYILAMMLAAICGLLTIHVLLNWVERIGYFPFVCYRVLLGIVLLTF